MFQKKRKLSIGHYKKSFEPEFLITGAPIVSLLLLFEDVWAQERPTWPSRLHTFRLWVVFMSVMAIMSWIVFLTGHLNIAHEKNYLCDN
jgi:hypothetical protein